jgi:hypothetical protein
MAEPEVPGFARERHVLFLEAMASELPADYASQEVNHLTLAYFAVAGLSLLRELDLVNHTLRVIFPSGYPLDPFPELRVNSFF